MPVPSARSSLNKLAHGLLILPAFLWTFTGGRVCFCAGPAHEGAADAELAVRSDRDVDGWDEGYARSHEQPARDPNHGDDAGCRDGDRAPDHECECVGTRTVGMLPTALAPDPLAGEALASLPGCALTGFPWKRAASPLVWTGRHPPRSRASGPPIFIRFCALRC